MYLFPSELAGRAVSTRKRKKEAPLVKKCQNTAQDLQLQGKYAREIGAPASAVTKAKRLRNRIVAGCIKEHKTSPHRTLFNLREKLKQADIIRKADLKTIASFLRLVLPAESIAEPGQEK
jgi:hypothetical protein